MSAENSKFVKGTNAREPSTDDRNCGQPLEMFWIKKPQSSFNASSEDDLEQEQQHHYHQQEQKQKTQTDQVESNRVHILNYAECYADPVLHQVPSKEMQWILKPRPNFGASSACSSSSQEEQQTNELDSIKAGSSSTSYWSREQHYAEPIVQQLCGGHSLKLTSTVVHIVRPSKPPKTQLKTAPPVALTAATAHTQLLKSCEPQSQLQLQLKPKPKPNPKPKPKSTPKPKQSRAIAAATPTPTPSPLSVATTAVASKVVRVAQHKVPRTIEDGIEMSYEQLMAKPLKRGKKVRPIRYLYRPMLQSLNPRVTTASERRRRRRQRVQRAAKKADSRGQVKQSAEVERQVQHVAEEPATAVAAKYLQHQQCRAEREQQLVKARAQQQQQLMKRHQQQLLKVQEKPQQQQLRKDVQQQQQLTKPFIIVEPLSLPNDNHQQKQQQKQAKRQQQLQQQQNLKNQQRLLRSAQQVAGDLESQGQQQLVENQQQQQQQHQLLGQRQQLKLINFQSKVTHSANNGANYCFYMPLRIATDDASPTATTTITTSAVKVEEEEEVAAAPAAPAPAIEEAAAATIAAVTLEDIAAIEQIKQKNQTSKPSKQKNVKSMHRK